MNKQSAQEAFEVSRDSENWHAQVGTTQLKKQRAQYTQSHSRWYPGSSHTARLVPECGMSRMQGYSFSRSQWFPVEILRLLEGCIWGKSEQSTFFGHCNHWELLVEFSDYPESHGTNLHSEKLPSIFYDFQISYHISYYLIFSETRPEYHFTYRQKVVFT